MTRPLVTIVYNSCIHVVRSRIKLIGALQEAGYEIVVVAPTDEATPRLAEFGIAHREVDVSQYGMNPVAELRYLRSVRKILRELNPVASLHYTVKPNTFGSIAAHQAGVPVLNNIAGSGRAFSGGNPLMRALVINLYRQGLGRSHTVFFQNGDDKEIFESAKLVRPEQCERIPGSGVDLSQYQATPLPAEGPRRFLLVGRMLKEKGVIEFLEAANTLLDEAPDRSRLHFDLVGEHRNESGFVSGADLARLTQAEEITYHGMVEPETIPELMRASSCVVLPSAYGEGVPRVLLEACASGRPIITTDNVGCRDVVEPGKNGWKVPVRDTAALTNAMREFMASSPSELEALAKGARHTAEMRFSEQIVIDAYLDRLASVTAEGRA